MTEVSERVNGTAKVVDPVLGTITVYREFIPRYDCIEYTTYFYKDGVKCRNDTRIDSADLEGFVETQEVEDFVSSKIRENIAAGDYGPAGSYIGTREQEYRKMQEVSRDEKFPTPEVDRLLESTPAPVEPTDTEKILITQNMRLYDLLYGLLFHFNPTMADEIYASHEAGKLGNPKMWIPEFGPGNVQEED